jgi:hypothetical protein
MLCCVGIFAGAYVGQSLGGHWTITGPAVGFAVGLYGDMKLMHGRHGQKSPNSNHKSKMSLLRFISQAGKNGKSAITRQ